MKSKNKCPAVRLMKGSIQQVRYWLVGDDRFPKAATNVWIEVKEGWLMNLFDGKFREKPAKSR